METRGQYQLGSAIFRAVDLNQFADM